MYLASQNIPTAGVLTLGTKVVLTLGTKVVLTLGTKVVLTLGTKVVLTLGTKVVSWCVVWATRLLNIFYLNNACGICTLLGALRL